MKRQKLNVQRIKERVCPADFYHLEQGLIHKYQGNWAEAGLCPFHDDRSPGSFFINLQNGAYRCFSCDAKGGDIIAFSMQKYDLSFKDALEWVANKEGL